MENSKIEWTHHTANLWHGCTKVHEGCDNCYAESLNHRWGHDNWGYGKPRKKSVGVWSDLKNWQQKAEKSQTFHRVFVGSMMDIFEISMPLVDSKGNKINETTADLRERFFTEVVPNSPNLIFLLLTKRPSNINKMIPESWKRNIQLNVWFGTSISTQQNFNTLVPQLLKVDGSRFLSIEPQVESIFTDDLDGIHWVIQGGESGHHKRPFDLNWAYLMQDICKKEKVPYFFKQIDKVQPIPQDLMQRDLPF